MEIIFDKVEHRYQANTPFEQVALYDINVTIPSKKFVAVIGHTGSGKSTFLQHLNGLLKPTSGIVKLDELEITSAKKQKQLKIIREKIGMVFQFPEHQLFEETVEKDICFGPINFGVSEEVAKKRMYELLPIVGLEEDIVTKSPFELSGGQMRRVAIAGVLAMDPEVLVLDEPTAGLDSKGQREIMEMFLRLHQQKKLTTILVTHQMEHVAAYADFVIVMNKGIVVFTGTKAEVFKEHVRLREFGLAVPETVALQLQMEEKFHMKWEEPWLTMDDCINNIKKLMKVDANE